MPRAGAFGFFLLAAALAVQLGACNDVSDCPSPASIQPDKPCSGDHLECAYDLAVAGAEPVETSCTCLSGAWSCPTAPSDDAAGGSDDASTLTEAEAAPDVGPAPTDASSEGSPDAGGP